MKKIIMIACSVVMGATMLHAQKLMDIKFENGQITMDEDYYAHNGYDALKSAKPKGSASVSKAGAPANPIFNDKAAMLKVSKEGDDWFLEVPDSIMGRYILAVTRFTAVPAGIGTYGGEQVRQQTCYFEKTPDKKSMLLRTKIKFIHADSTDVIYKAVKNSDSDPIIASFKIEKSDNNKSKIKATTLMLSENSFSIPTSAKSSLGATSMVSGSSYIESVHSYPINTEVRTIRTYNSNRSAAPTVTIGLNTSFLLLPETPMRQRIFDPRVGYFNDGYYHLSDNQQAVERITFVARRRLEPKNEEDAQKQRNGELIEPAKQIVYYIDPATPKQWRPYLIQGVKDWNSAFEQAGWKNAITAMEMPEDSSISMEDARYSFIMYLASDIANAYGPQNHDPRSGEIMESHVGWYHNVMTLVHDWYQVQCAANDPEARKAKYSEELMGQLIRFVSSHEIGHTLGLRHNFGASSTVPVDSLRSNSFLTKYGHCPSIMDYARFNYVAQPEDNIEIENLFPRINDYDKWAIEWGYKPIFDCADAEAERYVLNQETTKRLNESKRLWWGDGEGGPSDPRCQTEDLGDNAAKAGALGIENLKRIIPNLREWNYWGSDTNDSNTSTAYSQVVNQYKRYVMHVYRNLLGVNHTTLAPEQEGNVYQTPPLEKAQMVIPFMKEQVLTAPTWLVDVPYADRVFINKDSQLESITGSVIKQLASGSTISNVNRRYGSTQYLNDLVTAVFGNFDTSKPLTRYERFVQSCIVNSLCSGFKSSRESASSETLAAVLSTLKTMDKKFRNVTNSDPITEAHYAQLSDQIQRALIIK